MNRCKICGQPCGIYDICRECQKDIEDGKVKQCQECGKYYIAEKQCSCKTTISNKETAENNEQKINIEIENNTEQKSFRDSVKDGFGFGCGCLGISIIVMAIILYIVIDGITKII